MVLNHFPVIAGKIWIKMVSKYVEEKDVNMIN